MLSRRFVQIISKWLTCGSPNFSNLVPSMVCKWLLSCVSSKTWHVFVMTDDFCAMRNPIQNFWSHFDMKIFSPRDGCVRRDQGLQWCDPFGKKWSRVVDFAIWVPADLCSLKPYTIRRKQNKTVFELCRRECGLIYFLRVRTSGLVIQCSMMFNVQRTFGHENSTFKREPLRRPHACVQHDYTSTRTIPARFPTTNF